MSKIAYAPEKPRDCQYCYFWRGKKKGCSLGKENCYYLISVPPEPESECKGCPYGQHSPCIGWCTKQVMREVGVR